MVHKPVKKIEDYKSRKFTITILAMILVSIVGVLAGKWSEIQAIYATMCGAVTALVAIYNGGNVAKTHILAKNNLVAPKKEPAAKEEVKPE